MKLTVDFSDYPDTVEGNKQFLKEVYNVVAKEMSRRWQRMTNKKMFG